MVATPYELLLRRHRRPRQDEEHYDAVLHPDELNGDLAGTAERTGLPARATGRSGGGSEGSRHRLPCCRRPRRSSRWRGDDPTNAAGGRRWRAAAAEPRFPGTLIVPTIYGMKNVKRVERTEAVDLDYKGYWQTRGLSEPARTRSGVASTPQRGRADPRWTRGRGRGGRRCKSRLLPGGDSLDEGATWSDATLEPSTNPISCGGAGSFDSRRPDQPRHPDACTDGEGNVAR